MPSFVNSNIISNWNRPVMTKNAYTRFSSFLDVIPYGSTKENVMWVVVDIFFR